jgi:hypothetical protein
MLSDNAITYLTLSNGEDKLEHYDAVLTLADDGSWTWRSIQGGKIAERETPPEAHLEAVQSTPG